MDKELDQLLDIVQELEDYALRPTRMEPLVVLTLTHKLKMLIGTLKMRGL